MSRENVEVVRSMLVAWNAGDLERLRELWHPDAIVRPAAGWPEPGPFVGREAVMRSFEQLRDAWEADTLEATGDIIDIQGGFVQAPTDANLGNSANVIKLDTNNAARCPGSTPGRSPACNLGSIH